MEHTYKLSIVAIVYNLEKYLPRCLDSLVNQTLDNIEILCVDDGSSDSSSKIIDDYAEKYPDKIKAFHKENGGEFSARNYGLEKATGEYVTFVDTDDYVELNWAEKLYTAAKKNNADMVVCGFERIDLETNKVIAKNMTKFGDTLKEVNSNDDFILFINPAPWNKLYKRELIKDFRFLPFRCFNDTMFIITSYINIKKIAFVPEVLYHYYLRCDSQIHNINIKDIENLKKYLLEVKNTYIKYNVYDEYKYIIDLMAFLHLGMSAMYRISYNKEVNIYKEIKRTIQYLDYNFPTWRKSPFLKFNYSIKRGLKHTGIYIISKLYKWNLGIIYIKIYKFFIDNLKIDIKF